MPLSEHEQRMLAQMEEQLENDSRFVNAMRGTKRAAPMGRRLLIGGIGILAGIALMVAAVKTEPLIGVLAFLCIVLGVSFIFAPSRTKGLGVVETDGTVKPAKPQKQSDGTGFVQRMEERYEKRRRDGDL